MCERMLYAHVPEEGQEHAFFIQQMGSGPSEALRAGGTLDVVLHAFGAKPHGAMDDPASFMGARLQVDAATRPFGDCRWAEKRLSA